MPALPPNDEWSSYRCLMKETCFTLASSHSSTHLLLPITPPTRPSSTHSLSLSSSFSLLIPLSLHTSPSPTLIYSFRWPQNPLPSPTARICTSIYGLVVFPKKRWRFRIYSCSQQLWVHSKFKLPLPTEELLLVTVHTVKQYFIECEERREKTFTFTNTQRILSMYL